MSGWTFRTRKDPAETLDYTIDYSEDLLGSEPTDVILSAEWRVEGREDPPQLILATKSETNTTSTIYVLAGGKVGERYRLINRVNTFGGRVFERTILVEMVSK